MENEGFYGLYEVSWGFYEVPLVNEGSGRGIGWDRSRG